MVNDLSPDFTVNIFAAGNQNNLKLSALPSGGYIAVWESYNQFGSVNGLVGQLFNAFGERIGAPFQIEEDTVGAQYEHDVTALTTGGFVVTFRDANHNIITARVFDDAGTPVTGDFQVNTELTSTQQQPSIIALAGGDFMVAWASWNNETSTYDIRAQRFNSDGSADGGEITLNTTTTGQQVLPQLASLSNGNLAAVWVDQSGIDGNSHGVILRVFNGAGAQVRAETVVNTDTTNVQTDPQIVALTGGGFVVVWHDAVGDSNSGSVEAQVFDNTGAKVGTQFQVNQLENYIQDQPHVTATPDGGFFVTWYSYYDTVNTNYNNIMGRHYDASGVPQGDEMRINSDTVGYSRSVNDVVALANGLIVVTWTEHGGGADGDAQGVVQHLLSLDGSLTLPEKPILEAVSQVVNFAENDLQAAPGLLDIEGAVAVSGPADFDTGRLIVSRMNAVADNSLYNSVSGQSDDLIGVRNQGNGAGQVGVSGANVTYGGVVIGTIVKDGSADTNLEIVFNASADRQAVEAVVENLTYAITTDDPQEQVNLVILLEGGNGATADPVRVTVNVTPQVDAPQPVGPGDAQVNTVFDNSQDDPAVAALSDGGWVVMWESYAQDNIAANSWGVYGQRYGANGEPIGTEFRVNSNTLGNQYEVDVAGIHGGALDGGWVATWYDDYTTSAAQGYIRAQLYDATGAKVGGEIAVPTSYYSGTSFSAAQFPSVATFADGSFAIAFRSLTISTAGSSQDIRVQRFDASGAKIGSDPVINTDLAGTQSTPKITALAGGGYVVVWESTEVMARVFNAAGLPVSGNDFVVNDYVAGNASQPDVTALSTGGFVIVWADSAGVDGSGWGVYGQRYDASGTPVEGQFLVNEYTSSTQYVPSVTALPGGGFAVGYYSAKDGGNIFIQHYDAAGDRIDSEIRVSPQGGSTDLPALATLATGDVIVTWAQGANRDGDSNGIFQRIVGDAANYTAPENNPVVTIVNRNVTLAENAVNAAPQILFAGADVGDLDSADFDGGVLAIVRTRNDTVTDLFGGVDGIAQDNLGIRNQGNGAGQIGLSGTTVTWGGTAIGTVTSDGASGADLLIALNNAATPDAVEALLQNITYANPSDDPDQDRTYRVILTDGDGGTSTPISVQVTVTAETETGAFVASGGEEQVNSFEVFDQTQPDIAELDAGGYVVVWRSDYQDSASGSYGIYGQRYASDGTPLGDEFLVNTLVDITQYTPRVAPIATADGGGFVVVWNDNTTVTGDIKAQIFNDDGSPRGSEFAVEATINGTLIEPEVAQTPGGFVVVWQASQTGTTSYDIKVRQFDGDGTPVGAELTANTHVSGNQGGPAVAADGTGNFVVVWEDQSSQDGSSYGVYGQVFNAAGAKIGAEFRANTQTTDAQYEPAVAYLSDGRFVVTWRNNEAVDGSASSVWAQIFDAAGTKVGGEFLVNDLTTNSQYQPDVIALADGGFAIGYSSDGSHDGSGAGVFLQRFHADGTRNDGPILINEQTTSTQLYGVFTALSHDGADGFAAAWSSVTSGDAGDGSSTGVFTRIFGPEGTMTPANASPVLDNLDDTVVFEVATIGTPQLIDHAVSLTDADSADFAGGTVEIRYLDHRVLASDNLSVVAGKGITVSGSDVLSDGVVIGTIDATDNGVAGADLVIALNASANAGNVRKLLEQIGFSSTAPVDNQDRSVSFRVTDGDGGKSAGRGIDIQIETTVAPTFSLLEVDDKTVTEAQVEAGVLIDDAIDFEYTRPNGFAGGRIEIDYAGSDIYRIGSPFETLSVRSTGTGSGQISVSGSNVLYEGVVIGTIDATETGLKGNNLQINLLAAATPAAIEALLQAVQYQNTADATDPAVRFYMRVYDAANATTSFWNADPLLTIVPEVDSDLVFLGDEEQVNAFTSDNQTESSVAALTDGGFVVTWQSYGQDLNSANNYGIYQQRYDAAGTPVGPEVRVSESTVGNQELPQVIGLAGGGWLTVWQSPDASGSGIFGAFTDAAGNVGAEFAINTLTSSTQANVAVTQLSNGNILVAWESATSAGAGDGSSYGAIGRLFTSAGVALGNEFVLNTTTSNNQYQVDVAANGAGGFVAVWRSDAGDGNGSGVFGQRFDSAGVKVGAEFLVNTTTTGTQSEPSVARLNDGGFVVVWESPDVSSTGVFGQRYDAAGVKVGGEFQVNDITASQQADPDVVALADGGWFVTYWSSDNTYDVHGQRYDAAGNRVDGAMMLNDETLSTQYLADATVLADGRIVVTYSSYQSASGGDGSQYGVFMRMLGQAADMASADPVLSGVSDVTLDEAALNAGAVKVFAAGTVALSDPDSTDFDGGRVIIQLVRGESHIEQFRAPDDYAQDGMTLQGAGITIAGTTVSVGGVAIGTLVTDGQAGTPIEVLLNANATPERVETLLAGLHYTNPSNDPEATRQIEITVTDGDGGQTAHETLNITIAAQLDGAVKVGPEYQVNSYTLDQQDDSDVAALTGGGHVVVWTSTGQDNPGTSDNGVFAQLFDTDGQPIGPEFQVNTTFAGTQGDPAVIGLSDGTFVVAWEGNGSGDNNGIYAQRFNADGTQSGGEFRINSSTVSTQSDVALAANDSGGFIATFYDAATADVRARLFDNAGAAVGLDFVVNTTTTSTQSDPDVTTLVSGEHVVAWYDTGDTSIRFQRISATGTKVGPEVTVNAGANDGTQYQPAIAALTGGGFVVSWTDQNSTDGSSYGVYAQTFSATGVATGDIFLVNEVTASTQYESDVVGLSHGGFAITYRDDSATDGSGAGVFVQQYDANGNRIDGSLQVNTEFSSTQYSPAIAALADGAFVISYSSWTSSTAGDGSNYGVFSQIFGAEGQFATTGRPVLDGVNPTVTYLENDLNVGPHLLDLNNAAAVSDSDSADFDGGFLRVDNVIVTRGYQDQVAPPDNYTQDNLGLRQAQGITISGNAVFVDAVQVGTIVRDGLAGNPFEITLNANADAGIVELLVENLTYRNTSDDPEPSRVLRIQIGDGDGGVSDPSLVTVRITEQPDGATPVFAERQANTHTAGDQQTSDIARLDDGGFVIVWQSYNQDLTNTWGIYGQRFDANGNKVDGEFLVNTTTDFAQDLPAVSQLNTGGWVVTWTSSNGQDGSGDGVFMQRYGADGTKLGGEVQVNTYTVSTQTASDVTVLANGDYLVTWQSWNNTAAGGAVYDIYGRIYAADGSAPAAGPTGEFLINTNVTGDQDQPSVAALEGGGFVVAWEAASVDGSSDAAQYRVYHNAAGAYAPASAEMTANSFTAGAQNGVKVAGLADGGWVVVWQSADQDGSSTGIFAQLYDATGAAVSQEFRVNENRSSTQDEPDVAALSNGGFVVTFTDYYGPAGDYYDVYAQQYDANGNRVDGQQLVNTEQRSTQGQSKVVGLDNGGFVVSYNSYSTSGSADGSQYGVFYQMFGNSLPVVSNIDATTAEDTSLVFDAQIFADGFADAEGQLLAAIRIDVLPSVGQLEYNGSPLVPGQVVTVAELDAGALVYIPPLNFNGSSEFAWTGSDGSSFAPTPALTNIDVTPVNDPIGLGTIANQTIGEASSLNIQATLTDPDTESRTFTVNYGDGDADVVFSTNSKTPTLSNHYEDEGVYTVNLSVTDSGGLTESTSFTVTVNNRPPVANNDGYSTDEDTVLSGVNVFGNDYDPGNDSFGVTAINGTAYAPGDSVTLPSGAVVVIAANGALSYDPTGAAGLQALASGQNATDSFTYEITDADGATDMATVTIYVSGADDNVVAQDDLLSVSEDANLTGQSVFADNGNGVDFDPEGDALTVISVNGNASLVGAPFATAYGGILQINADGTLSFQTAGQYQWLGEGQSYNVLFSYVVEEAGSNLTASADGTITIIGVNDDPNANDDNASTDAEQAVIISVLANDTDIDNGDTLSVTGVGTPANGTAVVNLDGTITYTPDTGFSGSDSFTYDVSDGHGGTDTATVTVNVAGNAPPVAESDAFTVSAVATLTGDLFADNGSGADSDPEGDSFAVTRVNSQPAAVNTQITLASGGLLTVNGDGTFAYDPNGAFAFVAQGGLSSDSFTYQITDAMGGTDTATVTITITGVNDAPTMADGSGAATEDGTPVNIALGGLGNDVDTDDTGASLNYSVTTDPTEGTAQVIGTTLVFTPGGAFQDLAAGETRTVEVGVTATDQHAADSNEGTISVVVTGVNDAPTLTGGTMNAEEDGSIVTLDLSTLADDIDSDDDGSSLTYAIITQPGEGTAGIVGTTLSFDPGSDFQDLAAGDTRDVTIQVQATDSHTATSTIETITVTVTGVNDAPELTGATMAADEDGGAVTLDLSTLADDIDSDDDGSSLTYAIITQPGEGTAGIVGTTLSFDPGSDFQDLAAGDTRDVTIQVQATDSHTATSTIETITVTVTGVNDAPELTGATMAADEDGGVVTLDLSTLADDIDSDDDGSSLTYAIIAQPGEGTAGIVGTTLSFDPGSDFQDLAAGETRNVTIQVQATDSHTATSTIETITVTVTGVNDMPVAVGDSGVTAADTPLVLDVLANDSDPDGSDVLSVAAVGTPANGTAVINLDGTVTYTPDSGFNGVDSFTYDVSDGNGGTDTATVSVLVGANRTVTVQSIAVDETDGVTSYTVTYERTGDLSHTDVVRADYNSGTATEGDDFDDGFAILTFAPGETTKTTTLTVNGDTVVEPDETVQVVLTPEPGNDAGLALVDGTVTLLNDDATDYAIGDVSVAEGDSGTTMMTFTVTRSGDTSQVSPLLNVRYTDGTATAGSDYTAQSFVNFAFAAGQTSITLEVPILGDTDAEPDEDFTLTLYEVGPDLDIDSATGTILNDDNGAPVAADDGPYGVAEDTGGTTGDVLANDGDPENDVLAVTAHDGTTALGATVQYNGDGTFTILPGAYDGLNAGETVADSFDYVVSDGLGTDTATVTLSVTGANDAPELADGTLSAEEDGAAVDLDLAALGSDADDEDDGTTLLYSVTAQGAGGLASVSGTTLSFDPLADFQDLAAGETTVVSIGIGAEDARGATASAMVDVTVTGVNDDPTLAAGLLAATEDGSAVTLDLSTLGDDIDSDDNGSSLTYTILSADPGGSAGISGTEFTFTPGADFQSLPAGGVATLSFLVQAMDSHGATTTNTITVEVTGVNDAPVIDETGPFSVDENTTAVTTITASDVDGTPSFAIVGGADAALFTINAASGVLSFTTAPDYELPGDADGNNSYEVEIAASDGIDSDSFVFVVNVQDVNENTGPNVITGTTGMDRLYGTPDDDIIHGLGGPLDVMAGYGGNDTFVIRPWMTGRSETTYIMDYTAGEDVIDLGTATILRSTTNISGTTVFLSGGDNDKVVLFGVSDIADVDFVWSNVL